jgi:outer membrane lipopolysaccharide assembly protein LptE/RlpB
MFFSRRAPLLIILLFVLSGCGYHLAGMGPLTAWGISSMSMPVFINDTRKPDIEGAITATFINEFVNTVKIVDKGDAAMKGVVKSYTVFPISFAGIDVIQQYRLTLVFSLKIVKEDTGKVLWEDEISRYEDYTVNILDVTATNDAELAAMKKIASDSARLAKERVLERF